MTQFIPSRGPTSPSSRSIAGSEALLPPMMWMPTRSMVLSSPLVCRPLRHGPSSPYPQGQQKAPLPESRGADDGMVRPTGLEPVASRSATLRSIQLSYGRTHRDDSTGVGGAQGELVGRGCRRRRRRIPAGPCVPSRPGRVRRGRGSDFAEATSDKGGTGVPPHATAPYLPSPIVTLHSSLRQRTSGAYMA